MENTAVKRKKTSRIIPIICFIVFLATCAFNGEVAGFFLFMSVISFLFSAMLDPSEKQADSASVPNPLSADEWDAQEPFDLFADVSCNCMADVQVTVASAIGEIES